MLGPANDHIAATADLARRDWTEESRLEIPFGPCASFRTPGGQRIALYELARPGVESHFEGRRDF